MKAKKPHNIITIINKGVEYESVSDFARAHNGYNRSGIHSAIAAAYTGEDEFLATYKKNTFKVKISYIDGSRRILERLKTKLAYMERILGDSPAEGQTEGATNGK